MIRLEELVLQFAGSCKGDVWRRCGAQWSL